MLRYAHGQLVFEWPAERRESRSLNDIIWKAVSNIRLYLMLVMQSNRQTVAHGEQL